MRTMELYPSRNSPTYSTTSFLDVDLVPPSSLAAKVMSFYVSLQCTLQEVKNYIKFWIGANTSTMFLLFWISGTTPPKPTQSRSPCNLCILHIARPQLPSNIPPPYLQSTLTFRLCSPAPFNGKTSVASIWQCSPIRSRGTFRMHWLAQTVRKKRNLNLLERAGRFVSTLLVALRIRTTALYP